VVTALETGAIAEKRRVGFLIGQIVVPDDFDTLGAEEIGHLFGGVS
jgi:hypothetical protein